MLKQASKRSRDDEGRRVLLHEQGNISSAPVCTLPPGDSAIGRESPVSGWVTQVLEVPRHIWNSGLTCAFLASLIFSWSSLCVKLTGGRIPVLEVCFIRSSISFALTMVLMTSTGMSPKFGQRKNRLLLCARGCCGACSMTSNYVGLLLLPLGDAVTLSLIGPSVTAAAARVFLKEPLGYRGVAGCFVSMGGVIVLSKPPFLFGGEQWEPNQALGVFATVLSAFLGAGSSMTIRLIGNKESAAVIALWFHTCTMILTSLPLALGILAKVRILAPKDFGLMMGVACTSFVAQLLSTRGLQMVVAAKAAAMGFTQVFYSYMFGMFFFNEHITSGGLAGVLLILIGVLLVTMRSSKPEAVAGPAAVTAQDQLACEKAMAAERTKAGLDKLANGESEQLLGLAAEGFTADDAQEVSDAAVLVRAASKRAASGRLAETAAATPAGANRLTAFLQGQLQQGVAQAASGEGATAGYDAAGFDAAEYEQQMALVAAQAAAALGGELDPVAASSLAASRQASLGASFTARARSGVATPGMLSPTPSSFSAARSVLAAANNVVDIPRSRGISRGISRQVSGWLAANLLATTPADLDPQVQSSSQRVSDAESHGGASSVLATDAGVEAPGAKASDTSRQASRQPSGWFGGRLAQQQLAAEQQDAARLTEAFLDPSEQTSSSEGQQGTREVTFAGPWPAATPQRQVKFSGTDDVRAASELAKEGSVGLDDEIGHTDGNDTGPADESDS